MGAALIGTVLSSQRSFLMKDPSIFKAEVEGVLENSFPRKNRDNKEIPEDVCDRKPHLDNHTNS